MTKGILWSFKPCFVKKKAHFHGIMYSFQLKALDKSKTRVYVKSPIGLVFTWNLKAMTCFYYYAPSLYSLLLYLFCIPIQTGYGMVVTGPGKPGKCHFLRNSVKTWKNQGKEKVKALFCASLDSQNPGSKMGVTMKCMALIVYSPLKSS